MNRENLLFVLMNQKLNNQTFQNFKNDKELCAYLAGAIDCDGSIVAQFVRRKDYKLGYQIRCTVQLSQKKKRRQFLDELYTLVGLGYRRERGDMFDWIVTDTQQVKILLEVLRDYLRMKQAQAVLILDILERLPNVKNDPKKFLQVAELVDSVSSLNDSILSKRIHTAETVRNFFVSKGFIE